MIAQARNSITLAVCGSLLLLLSGCAGYRTQPLVRLETPAGAVAEKKDAITFAYHAFTRKDCAKYLDRDVIKKGYQPVHISIVNNTKRSVYFSRSKISLVTANAEEVAELVHTNTAGRAAGYGIAGIFLWPLLIPAIVDGIGSSEANKKLDADFTRKALCDQTIRALESLNGLIFVPVESYKPDFEITLIDSETAEPIVLRTNQAIVSEFCE